MMPHDPSHENIRVHLANVEVHGERSRITSDVTETTPDDGVVERLRLEPKPEEPVRRGRMGHLEMRFQLPAVVAQRFVDALAGLLKCHRGLPGFVGQHGSAGLGAGAGGGVHGMNGGGGGSGWAMTVLLDGEILLYRRSLRDVKRKR